MHAILVVVVVVGKFERAPARTRRGRRRGEPPGNHPPRTVCVRACRRLGLLLFVPLAARTDGREFVLSVRSRLASSLALRKTVFAVAIALRERRTARPRPANVGTTRPSARTRPRRATRIYVPVTCRSTPPPTHLPVCARLAIVPNVNVVLRAHRTRVVDQGVRLMFHKRFGKTLKTTLVFEHTCRYCCLLDVFFKTLDSVVVPDTRTCRDRLFEEFRVTVALTNEK